MWTFATSPGQAPVGDSTHRSPALPLASLSFSMINEQAAAPTPTPTPTPVALARPRAPTPLPLASISPAAAAKEPHTGVAFPGDYCVHTRGHCPELTGTG
jgi:hypothetical protein